MNASASTVSPISPAVMPAALATQAGLKFINEAVRGSLALPTVPHVVRRMIAQLKAGDVTVNELVAELEQEPQLAARTLRIANSPFYAGRRSLSSLNDAVSAIGTDALRTLVISCGLTGVFVNVPGVNLRQFWLNASMAAQAARGLARLAGGDGEAAYLAGLLHSSGHLILCQAFPNQLQQALASAESRQGQARVEVERAACGIGHPEVGAAWLDGLSFPLMVIEAVALYLDPLAAEPGALAPLLNVATQMAASVEVGDSLEAALQKIDAALLQAAGIDAQQLPVAFAPHYEQLFQVGGLP